MNKVLLTCLCTILLLVGIMLELAFFSSRAIAQGNGIIVDGADYISTITDEYSAELATIANEVTLRVVVEYGNFNSKLELNKSDELDQAASVVSSRVVVEYADFVSTYESHGNTTLLQVATNVMPRIIVEYADFIFGTDLGPKPMEDITPPVIGVPIQNPPPEMVMPYQNVTVSANITDAESGVRNATLQYNLNSSATWSTVIMSYNSTSSLYYATILGQSEGTYVKYKIVAYDNADNMAVEDNAGQYYAYTVIPEFPSSLTLLLVMFLSMFAIVLAKRVFPRKPNT